MNHVKITGNVVFNAELKKTYSGKSVVNFVVDTKRKPEDATSDYVDCVAWNERAVEFATIAKSGTAVEIEGHIVNDNYVDRNGLARKIQKVLATRITVLEDQPCVDMKMSQ
jgi:single-strand DNA-binding protein